MSKEGRLIKRPKPKKQNIDISEEEKKLLEKYKDLDKEPEISNEEAVKTLFSLLYKKNYSEDDIVNALSRIGKKNIYLIRPYTASPRYAEVTQKVILRI